MLCYQQKRKINFINSTKKPQNKAVVDQYTQFINDKEVIRKKAVVKYQNELKSRMQKILEHDVLLQQMNKVKKEHSDLADTVNSNKKFKDFLTDAIDLLPDSTLKIICFNKIIWTIHESNFSFTFLDYLEAGDSKYVTLMSRHQTLYESNLDLFENLICNADKVIFSWLTDSPLSSLNIIFLCDSLKPCDWSMSVWRSSTTQI